MSKLVSVSFFFWFPILKILLGFVLYAISKEGNKLGATLTGEPIKEFDSSFFRTNPIAAKVDYLNKQDVTGRFRLKPGKYLLIPTTYQKDHELSFMLRVLVAKSDDTRKTYKSKKLFKIKEIEE